MTGEELEDQQEHSAMVSFAVLVRCGGFGVGSGKTSRLALDMVVSAGCCTGRWGVLAEESQEESASFVALRRGAPRHEGWM